MRARRPRRTLLAGGWLALASALALLGPAIASADKAGSVTASGGAVQATLSWQAADFGVKDPRLIIARAGAPLFDGSPLADAEVCSVGCVYAPSKDYTPLHVADLGGDVEPEVVVDSYTGGAHCCIVSDVLYFTGAAYARAEHNWGSYGYALEGPQRRRALRAQRLRRRLRGRVHLARGVLRTAAWCSPTTRPPRAPCAT